MMAILMALAVAAEPSPEQRKLLQVFRSEFIAITPGTGQFPSSFKMGHDDVALPAERPVHEVTLAYPFHVAKYEVPQNLWEVVMGSNPSKWKGPRNSVEMLSFAEAVEFCQKATELMLAAELIDAKQVVRLPSEAEWEYFARAGTNTRYSFGDEVTQLGDYGWFTGNAAGNDPPVGAKKPNGWGLYDVHGYLWEWCLDAAHENYEGAPTDGSAWGSASDRGVVRSGSWKNSADQLTSSHRRLERRELRDDAVGLRCVLAEQPSP